VLSFEDGDFVYLKVSPMRGLSHFKGWGKLAPRFIGPFKIIEKRGEVAYQLELAPRLKKIFLIKSIQSKSWIRLKQLLETRRSKCAKSNGATIPRKKLLGRGKKSWRLSFQISFPIRLKLRDEIHLKGGRFITPYFL
jgi:hypothetical protein